MTYTLLHLPVVPSTNSVLREKETAQEGTVIWADHQTAGRGQGSNTWQSNDSENLLFSVKVCPPQLRANEQFVISVAGALAIHAALLPYGDEFRIKWPNDIFFRDKKISGTLIEHSVAQKRIQHSIIGCGINVNQQTFPLLPHATSLRQITGHDVNRQALLDSILTHLAHYYHLVISGQHDTLFAQYHQHLYHPPHNRFRDNDGTFTAHIDGVARSGHLLLRDTSGTTRRYATHHLAFLLP